MPGLTRSLIVAHVDLLVEVEVEEEVEEVEEAEVEHLLVGVLCAGNKYTNSKDPFLHFMPLMYISVKTTLPYTYIYIRMLYLCSS